MRRERGLDRYHSARAPKPLLSSVRRSLSVLLHPLFALLLAASLPGCLLVAGAAIAAGVVHTVGDDVAEVTLESSTERVFEASENELASRSNGFRSYKGSLRIEGRVGASDVTITLDALPKESTRLRVVARKHEGLSPDVETAHQVAFAIVKRVMGRNAPEPQTR